MLKFIANYMNINIGIYSGEIHMQMNIEVFSSEQNVSNKELK